MRQLTEDMIHRAAPATPLKDAPAPPSSDRSVRGEGPPNPESLESAGVAAVSAREQPSTPKSTATQPHPSSVMSTIQEPGNGGTSSIDEELESTAGTPDAVSTATAHRIVDPLRRFIAETCSAEQHDPECALIRRSLRLEKAKSGDMKFAREVDFDSCVSPSPRTPNSPANLGTPRVRGACLEFGLDATGTKPLKVEPYSDVDQYSPMTPKDGSSSGSGIDGTGRHYFLRGRHATGSLSPQMRQRYWSSRGAAGITSQKSLSQGASPRGSFEGGSKVGGFNVCEAGAPPGLLPTARIEGSKESMELAEQCGERVGEPSWFDPVQDEKLGESETNVSSEINDVCSQLQSSGI